MMDHYFWGILLDLFRAHGSGRFSFTHFIRNRQFRATDGNEKAGDTE
jgi:hypothetical protein